MWYQKSLYRYQHSRSSLCSSELYWQYQVALVKVDLAITFDRIDHWFLFKLLQHINAGTILLEGIRLCYHSCSTSLIIISILSSLTAVQSSVKQRCPLSPLIFAFYLEPLRQSVICSTSIIGYRLLLAEVKVLAYVDDVTFFCAGKRSVDGCQCLTDSFSRVVGATINKEECNGSWVDIFGPQCRQSMQSLPRIILEFLFIDIETVPDTGYITNYQIPEIISLNYHYSQKIMKLLLNYFHNQSRNMKNA